MLGHEPDACRGLGFRSGSLVKQIDAIFAVAFSWNGPAIGWAPSIGIAPVTADRTWDPLADADACCVAAKGGGRGCVEVVQA